MASLFSTSRYKSLARPRFLGTAAGSSDSSSFVRKQLSAEDAVVDNQYEAGQISAEAYKSHLNTRLQRVYLTPAQQVTLREKVLEVDRKLTDSKVDTAYKSGEISTRQVLEYEKNKLNQIPQTDSVAFQQQSQRVQSLQDKFEREERTKFRNAELLRISQLPDTSENLYEKAQLYDKLEQQARIDGDETQAQTLAIQKQNTMNSAKRASINDFITSARLSVSETPTLGRGIPSADGGENLNTSLSTGSPEANVSGNSDSVASGSVGSSPAVRNALKSLDRSQKTIERLYGQKQDSLTMIGAYDQAIAQAEGDQKTSLIIARNNLADSIAGIDNSIALAEDGVNTTIQRIQELQASAAKSGFNKQFAKEKAALADEENNLEYDLRTGKISKYDYIFESAKLVAAKVQLNLSYADGYSQYGEDDKATDLINEAQQKFGQTGAYRIYNQITGAVGNETDQANVDNIVSQAVQQIADNYEVIRVSENGEIDNITSSAKSRGDLMIKDVSEDKINGTFNNKYVKDGNVYAEIKFPKKLDALGQTVAASPEDAYEGKIKPYYFNASGEQKDIKYLETVAPDGTQIRQPVTDSYIKDLIGTKNSVYKDGTPRNLVVGEYNGKPSEVVFRYNPNTKLADGTEVPKTSIVSRAMSANTRPYVGDEVANQGIGNRPKNENPLEKAIINIGNAVYNNPVGQGFVEGASKLSQKKPLNPFEIAAGAVFVPYSAAKSFLGLFDKPKDVQASEANPSDFNQPSGRMESKSINPNSFDESVKLIALESGIPESVIRGVAAAETNTGEGRTPTGYASRNNFFNIGAYDSNPDNAFSYPTALDGVRAFAKLLTTDPRYSGVVAAKGNPQKMVEEMKKAGYASNPNYVQLVTGTPEFRNNLNNSISPRATAVNAVQPQTVGRVVSPTPTPKYYSDNDLAKPLPTVTPVEAVGRVIAPVVAKAPNIVENFKSFMSPTNSSQRDDFAKNIGMATQNFAKTTVKPVVQNVAKAAINSLPPVVLYNEIKKNVQNPEPLKQTIKNVGSAIGSSAAGAANNVKKLWGSIFK